MKRKTYRNKKGQFCKKPSHKGEYICLAIASLIVAIHYYFNGFLPAVEYIKGVL